MPIRQSLGALTAAQEASRFARNVLAEHGSNPRMLIVHEVMGRASGWLTAAAARDYMQWHSEQEWLPGIGLDPRRWAIHAVYVPELGIDLAAEADRLRAVMDEIGCVNIFLAEGAGIDDIVADLESSGEVVGRDPFGHVKIDTINPGRYFADRFAREIGAEKQMVQKSGYFSRSAPAGDTDLALIREMAELAVRCALDGVPGVIGHDEDRDDELRAIEFERIAGHKPFDTTQEWFTELLGATGAGLRPSPHTARLVTRSPAAGSTRGRVWRYAAPASATTASTHQSVVWPCASSQVKASGVIAPPMPQQSWKSPR